MGEQEWRGGGGMGVEPDWEPLRGPPRKAVPSPAPYGRTLSQQGQSLPSFSEAHSGGKQPNSPSATRSTAVGRQAERKQAFILVHALDSTQQTT